MKTSSFCGLDFEVLSNGDVRLSLETSAVDLSIYMSNEEIVMFSSELVNIMRESAKKTKKKKQQEELVKEQRR